MLSDSINARRETTFVPNSNDDDVIKNYITDMDLGEDSDSHNIIYIISGDIINFLATCSSWN